MRTQTPVGRTKDRGWEIGVRRTTRAAPDALWAALMSPDGRAIWLRVRGDEPLVAKMEHRWDDVSVRVISIVEGSMIRFRWKSDLIDIPTVVQIRVLPAKNGATLSFFQDLLTGPEQREQMRDHWERVIGSIFGLV